MQNELGKLGKMVLITLGLSGAAYLFFYSAMVPFDTDKQFGKVFRPFGITMSFLFLLFGISVWSRRYSRRTAIIFFFALVFIYVAGTLIIGGLVSRPDPPYYSLS